MAEESSSVRLSQCKACGRKSSDPDQTVRCWLGHHDSSIIQRILDGAHTARWLDHDGHTEQARIIMFHISNLAIVAHHGERMR